jgi:hypothetical protein
VDYNAPAAKVAGRGRDGSRSVHYGTSAHHQDYGDRTKMTPKLTHERIAQMTFASICPLYVNKVEKKGRTEADLQKVITWLTGFTKAQIKKHITAKTTFEEFFKKAKLNPNASKIKGVICGYRVEEIEDPLTQKCRYLDELARGKKMENILRS